jgi:dTDP-6-deoxy-L-talose 4-dehydrogenase (NAD+)
MNVLVTGATGFIGQHVVPKLLRMGDSVTAVARSEAKARRFPWFDAVRFLARDVHQTDERPMEYLDGIDAVIHLAWSGLPNYKEEFHIEENLFADFCFLRKLPMHGVRHLLVAGTCLEFGMQSGPLAETDTTAPCTAYGVAKDSLRKFLELAQEKEPFILQWARLFYLHGAGQHPKSLLAQLDRAIDRNDPVFNMSGGEQLRDYLAIEKAAAYLVALVHQRQLQGAINVCSGTPLSVRRLVEDHVSRRSAKIRLNMGHYRYPDYEPMAFWGAVGKLSALQI